MTESITPTSPLAHVRDAIALTKPRITFIVLVTAAAGMKLAPGRVSGLTWFATLVGTALIVGSANALNMALERDVDGQMARTRNRPLPTGRLSIAFAWSFGVALALISLPILAFLVNPVVALLGAVALVSYVLVYTPMKRHSTWALWVGAVPGAIPPLLGFSAVTGRIDLGGLAIFAILFVWQIPHFLAISVFRASEYARAGLKVVPVEKGDRATDRLMLAYTVALCGVSLLPLSTGIGGMPYFVVALLLGAGFLVVCLRKTAERPRWARGVFAYSLLYLVALFAALVVGA